MAKKSKYHNYRVEGPNGEKFDSKKELARYNELVRMEREGLIWNLRRQVKYTLLQSIYEDVPVQLKRKVSIKKKLLFRDDNP